MSATPPDDGPWRIAPSCVLAVWGGPPGDPRVAARVAALRGGGGPIAHGLAAESGADLARLLAVEGEDLDILWLHADAAIDAATLDVLRRAAASDPMIAGVSPRASGREASEDWHRLLPPLTYVPLGDPRCLYVKGAVLRALSVRVPSGQVDWDALSFALNAGGFRVVVANRATFGIAENAAPLASLAARGARLDAEVAGAGRAVAAFLSGTPRQAERILAGLVRDRDGRRIVAFDMTHLGGQRSGTAEVALALIRCALTTWRLRWEVVVIATAATHRFHFGRDPEAPRRLDPADPAPCAAVIRIGQPFRWADLDAPLRRAPTLVVFMLDTIGLDCLLLAPDDLDALWRFTLAEADGLVFNSAFTRRQYDRRFAIVPAQPRATSLHSLSTTDYVTEAPPEEGDGTLLVIGNGFAHKRVAETARLLARAYPHRPIAALGLRPGAVPGVAAYASGALDAATVASLYRAASVVIYPTLYEGFGLPVLEALGHRKPILVRDLPPFAEIADGTPQAANIHVFTTDEDLVRRLAVPPRWTESRRALTPRDWNDALADLEGVLSEALCRVDYERVVRRLDFLRGRLAFARHKPFAGSEADETVDRLAAMAGRAAVRAVRALARLPGAAAALSVLAGRHSRGAGP